MQIHGYSPPRLAWPRAALDNLAPVLLSTEPTQRLQRVWTCDDQRLSYSRTPTVAKDGTLYVGNFNHCVYAIDAKDGQVRWEYRTKSHLDRSPAIGPDGRLYAVSRDMDLHVIDAKDGHLLHRHGVGPVLAGVSVDGQGTAYASSLRSLVAVQPGRRQPLWEITGSFFSTATLSRDQKTVYAADNSGTLQALKASSGASQWNYKTGGALFAEAVEADERVFVGSFDHKLYAIDAASGTRVWDFAAQGPVGARPCVSAEGTVFFTSHDGNLYALDAQSGEKKWDFAVGGRLDRSPLLGPDNTVLIGSQETSTLHALDRDSGQVRWSLDAVWPLHDNAALSSDGSVAYVPTQSKSPQLLALHNCSREEALQIRCTQVDRMPAGQVLQEGDSVILGTVRVPRRSAGASGSVTKGGK